MRCAERRAVLRTDFSGSFCSAEGPWRFASSFPSGVGDLLISDGVRKTRNDSVRVKRLKGLSFNVTSATCLSYPTSGLPAEFTNSSRFVTTLPDVLCNNSAIWKKNFRSDPRRARSLVRVFISGALARTRRHTILC